jgi:hypothetical protein
MKQFTVNKLDRRHNGYKQFTHYITPIPQWGIGQLEYKLRFFEWRKWCWETWGPGMEREIAIELGSRQFEVCRWAWHTEDRARRLYFASEKELSWFILTWSSE